MSKHETDYARQDRDFPPTRHLAIEALAEQVELCGKRILECACGDGRMTRALEAAGAYVTAFNIEVYGNGRVRDFSWDDFPEEFDGTVTILPTGPAARRPSRSSKRAFGASATGSSLFFCRPISIPR
jgi:hypothetical protein